jgi:hypothetical protein
MPQAAQRCKILTLLRLFAEIVAMPQHLKQASALEYAHRPGQYRDKTNMLTSSCYVLIGLPAQDKNIHGLRQSCPVHTHQVPD